MSLERRLLGGIAAGLLPAFAALLWLGSLAISEVTQGFVATRLQHDSEALLGQLNWDEQGRLQLRDDLTPVYRQPLSGHYYVILSDGQQRQSRSLWDESLALEPLSPGEQRTLNLSGPGGQPLLAVIHGYRKQGHAVSLLVAEDVTRLQARITQYRWWLAGIFLLLGAALMAGLRRLLRRSFAPLHDTCRQLQGVAEGRREALDETVPDEILPLVREVNRLLQLIGERLGRSRKALGNLAHALKTPLSLIAQVLETPAPDDAQRQAALSQIANIRDRVERELRRAQLAGNVGVGQHFDPAREIPDLLQVLQQLHAGRALSFDVNTLPVRPISIDREDMLELLGNLLDNACKWARSRVALRLAMQDGCLRIDIEDDGPGVADSHLPSLIRRGERLDEQREGHGLGLAISHDIVSLYGGELRFTRSETLGGLAVRLTIPLAGSSAA